MSNKKFYVFVKINFKRILYFPVKLAKLINSTIEYNFVVLKKMQFFTDSF